MQITAATLLALQQGFNAAFVRGFGSAAPTWGQVAMSVPSTADAENYGWMKELPGMREWIGKRVIHNLEATSAKLVNKHYEHTIGVDADNIRDDKLGIYAPMFSMQGEIAARHPDQLVWGLLPNGFATKGFDGQYFFDTDLNVFLDRQYLYGVDARYVAGFGFHQLAYGSKATLDAAAFAAARLVLETQKRPDGTPLPVMATHLVCGPTNRAAAEAILKKEYLTAGETNTNYKAVELIVNPFLG